VKDVMKKLQGYVDEINENIHKLEARGPVSKYALSDENLRGRWDFLLNRVSLNSVIIKFCFTFRYLTT